MEEHNQLTQCIGAALSGVGRSENVGLYFMDGFRLRPTSLPPFPSFAWRKFDSRQLTFPLTRAGTRKRSIHKSSCGNTLCRSIRARSHLSLLALTLDLPLTRVWRASIVPHP